MDLRGGENFGEGVDGAELRVGVCGAVEVVDAGDFGEVGRGCAVSWGMSAIVDRC